MVHSQPGASESVMSPRSHRSPSPRGEGAAGPVGLGGGHLLRAVLVAVEHCAAELAAGLRERSAMEPSRGHRARVASAERERARPRHARVEIYFGGVNHAVSWRTCVNLYFKYSKNRTLALWSGSIHLPPQPFLPWRLEYTLKTKSSPSEAATGRPLDGLSTAPNFIRRVHVAVAHVDRPQPQRRGVTFLKPRALIGMPGWSKAVQLQRPWTGPERNRIASSRRPTW